MAEQGCARRPFCELNGQQADHASEAQQQPGLVKAWRGDAACTLRDLCAEDKRKVAKLIRQVVEAEQRVQALTAQAQEEADTRQRELERLRMCTEKAVNESAHLRKKLARALALLRTYQSRLRAAHASAAAAPPPPAPLPEASGAADAPLVSAPPVLPAPRAAREEGRSLPAGHCPTCCQREAGTAGSGGAGDRVRADESAAAAPAAPDALADLAASLLAWQLRRGGASLEGLGSVPTGSAPAPEPALTSMSAPPQHAAGGAGGGRALRFDPSSGRSGAFVYEDAGGPAGPQQPSKSAEAACAAAAAECPPGSGAGQHSGAGGAATRGQSAWQTAAPADATCGEAGAQGAARMRGLGAAAADGVGGRPCQGRGAMGGAAGAAVQRWAGSGAAGPLADRAPAAAAAGAAGAERHPGPGLQLSLAADEHAPWRQHARAAHAREGSQAAVRAEAVRTQPGEQAAEVNAAAARGAPAQAPAGPEPDLDASLIDLVAEVERLQAGAEALSRGTPSPKPGSKPSVSCRPHSPRRHSPQRAPERGWRWAANNQLVRGYLQGDAWDSSSLFEENDVVSLISEQEWDL